MFGTAGFELFKQTTGWAAIIGLFAMAFITLIKSWPVLQRNALEARERRESRYSKRISQLEEAVRRCQQECEDHKDELRKEITGLQKQHLSEQLALVRTIVQIFPDAPALNLLLRALETGRRSVEYLGEITGDAQHPTAGDPK